MKKLFTFLLIITAFSAKADYWTQKADFGGLPRHAAIGFSIGTKGYIGTGRSGNIICNDFWEYDPSINIWTQKADLSYALQGAVGFSIGNKGYIGTGLTFSFNVTSYFWEYDPATNTWSQKTSNPTARAWATGFGTANKGYISGGVNNAGGTGSWMYDPAINSWSSIPVPGGFARLLTTAFSDGTKGYIGTGTQGSYAGLNDFWEWEPNTNVWTQKADFGGTARSETCSFWLCPFGYLGLGTTYIGSGTVSDFWKYDITNNTWTQVANFGNGLREMAVAFSIADKGYVGTGWINDSNEKNDFWEYTPDTVCITSIEELSTSNFQFTISPNPAHEYANISWSSAENKNAELLITTLEGKKVYETKLLRKESFGLTSGFRLPTSHFPKGIYLVQIISDKKVSATKKLVVE